MTMRMVPSETGSGMQMEMIEACPDCGADVLRKIPYEARWPSEPEILLGAIPVSGFSINPSRLGGYVEHPWSAGNVDKQAHEQTIAERTAFSTHPVYVRHECPVDA